MTLKDLMFCGFRTAEVFNNWLMILRRLLASARRWLTSYEQEPQLRATHNKQELRLQIDLVPRPCFYSNVREVVSKREWDRIRKEAYRQAGYKCESCGQPGKLHCHEVWRYDDKGHIQHLDGFQALCENCHMIKHVGFSMHTPAGRAKYDPDELIEHFCRVNTCNRGDFLEHEAEAFRIWEERSSHEWKQPWIKEFEKGFR